MSPEMCRVSVPSVCLLGEDKATKLREEKVSVERVVSNPYSRKTGHCSAMTGLHRDSATFSKMSCEHKKVL